MAIRRGSTEHTHTHPHPHTHHAYRDDEESGNKVAEIGGDDRLSGLSLVVQLYTRTNKDT